MRSATVLAVVAAAASAGAPAIAAGQRSSAAERTNPHMRPATGGARTAFSLLFTLRETPGHTGVQATDYRVEIASPAHAPARCAPPQPAALQTGHAGETERVRFTSPSRGWCPGRYGVTVYLERGPYCPRPAAGQPPRPCPEFATQELDVGETQFTVR